TGLHDDRQVLALTGQQFELPDRIAVDDQEVGERAGLHHSEPAGHAHDLGTDDRGLPDDLDRRKNLAAQQELAALIDLQLAEEIAAVAYGHAGALADLQRLEAAIDDEIVLRQHLGGHPEFLRALPHRVIGDQIRDQVGTFL